MQQINEQTDFPMEEISDAELRRRFQAEQRSDVRKALSQPQSTCPKKIARGRGNQGDWSQGLRNAVGELEHHKDHNAKVEAKKAAKRLRQQEKRMQRV